MVFEDKNLNRRYSRPQGVKYTKTNLEMNDLYSRVVSDKDSIPAAQEILAKYGYSKANSATQLAHKLSAIVMNAGEPALKDIANIHPDKDFILSLCSVPQEPITVIKEVIKEVPAPAADKNMHDCGCGGHHSAEGHVHSHGNYRFAEGMQVETEKNKYLKPALLVSFTALAIAVIFKW